MILAGAQIPVTPDLDFNYREISQAIEWAGKNNVDYLLTPEGALSGYGNVIRSNEERNKLLYLEQQLIEESSYYNINLCLGTIYWSEELRGDLRRNQIRFYDKQGNFCGAVNKQMLIPMDTVIPGETFDIIDVDNKKVTGLICNDMWGEYKNKTIATSSMRFFSANNVEILFHATNGPKGDVLGDIIKQKRLYDWCESNLYMQSLFGIPIVTVDSTTTLSGEPIDNYTSSPSGILSNGEWLVQCPPNKKHYFKYEIINE